jgi:transcriptional regulator with XRE-family HTH domain
MIVSEMASRITELRNRKGLTQKELAELCNVNIRTIQRIESGDVIPRKHTLKLLSAIFGYDLNALDASAVEEPKTPNKPAIRLAFIAGLIFSVNAIAVVFDLITGSLNETSHIITVLIHVTSCIFFYRGFYMLGKFRQNRTMEISFLLCMCLLPLINIMELLKPYYFNVYITSIVFTLLCISVILCGAGLLIETYNRSNLQNSNYYKFGGTAIVIQGAMFLSTDFTIVSVALILSLVTNFLLIAILRSGYTTTEKTGSFDTREVLA